MRDDTGERAREVEVLVCRKCLMRGGARGGGLDLPHWLQGALAERGLSEQVRVLPTGCMNQCPRGRVTVLVTGGDGRGGGMMLVEPRLQREQLVRLVERRARGEESPPLEDPRADVTQPLYRRVGLPGRSEGEARGEPAPAEPAGDERDTEPR